MEGKSSNYGLITECVNALIKEPVASVSDLGNAGILSHILSILKNTEFAADEHLLTEKIEHILKDNFIASDLVNLKEVFTKNCHEIFKLVLLLIYISLLSDSILRQQLLNSLNLNHSDEFKLKYLLENIQKRGRGISKKYLDILVDEDLDGKEFGHKFQTPKGSWSSPTVFTSSPKTSQSPLRELLHSPPFQMQKLLNDKSKELKKCQQQVYSLETDNQELALQNEISLKRQEKLEREREKVNLKYNNLRTHCETLETRCVIDAEEGNKQLTQLRKDVKLLRSENESLQKELRKALDENFECSSKLENLRSRFTLTESERDRLSDEVFSLRQACTQNENLIEAQAFELNDFKRQLEELERHLLEFNKQHNRTIEESFDGVPFNLEASGCKEVSMCSIEGENLGSTIVDKILSETKAQVESLEAKNSALNGELLGLVDEKEVLTAQVDKCKEGLHEEKRRVETLRTQLECKEESCLTLKDEFTELKSELELKGKNYEAQLEVLKREHQSEKEVAERLIVDLTNQTEEYSKTIGTLETKLKTFQKEMEEERMNHQLEKSEYQKSNEEKVKDLQHTFETQLAQKEGELQEVKVTLTVKEEESLKTLETLQQDRMTLQNELKMKGELHKIEMAMLNEREEESSKTSDILREELKSVEEQLKTEKKKHLVEMAQKEKLNENNLTEVRNTFETRLTETKRELTELETSFKLKENDYVKSLECVQKEYETLHEEFLKAKEFHATEMSEKMKLDEEKIIEIQNKFKTLLTKKEEELERVKATLNERETESSMTVQALRGEMKFLEAQLNIEKENHEMEMAQKLKLNEANLAEAQNTLEACLAEKEKTLTELKTALTLKEEDFEKTQKTLEGEMKTLQNELEKESKRHKTEMSENAKLNEEKMRDTQDTFKTLMAEKEEELERVKATLNEKEKDSSETVEALRGEMKSLEAQLKIEKENYEMKMAQILGQNEDNLTEARNTLETRLAEKERALTELNIALTFKEEDFAKTRKTLEEEKKTLQIELERENKLHKTEMTNLTNNLTETRARLREELNTFQDELKRERDIHQTEMSEKVKLNEEKMRDAQNTFESCLTEKERELEEFKLTLKEESLQIQETLQEELKTLQTELNNERVTRDVEVATLNTRENESSKTVEALREELKYLEAQLEADKEKHEIEMRQKSKLIEDSLTETKNSLSSLTVEKEMLRMELQSTISLKKEETTRSQTLQKELGTLKKELKNLRDLHETEMSEKVKLDEEKMRDAQNTFESCLTEKERELEEIKLTLKEESLQIQETLQEELKTLQTELNNERVTRDVEVATLNMRENESSKTVEALREELKYLEAQLKTDKEKHEIEMRQKSKLIEDSLAETKNSLSSLTVEKEMLRKELESTISLKKEETTRSQTLQEELGTLQKELKNLRDLHETKMTALNETAEESSKTVEALREELKYLEAQLEIEKEKHEMEMAQKLKLTDDNLEVTRNSFETLLAEKERALTEIKDELKKRVSESDSLVKTLHTENEELKGVKQSMEKKLEDEIAKGASSLAEKEEELTASYESKLTEKEKQLEEIKELRADSETKVSSLEQKMKNESEKLSLERKNLLKDIENKEKLLLERESEFKRKMEAEKIDMQKEISTAKEDVMRVERESEKTIQSLKEEIQSMKEKSQLEKQAIMKMKTAYKAEIEAITEEVSKNEEVEKNLQLMKQKYEVAKKKMKETVSKLTESETDKEKFKEQANSYRERISKMTESVERDKQSINDLTLRVKKLEEERQPLKDKLVETENNFKKTAAENRSLEAQLKMADSAIRDLKKQDDRQNLAALPAEFGLQRFRPQIVSASSSNEEDLGDNSQTLLLPDKKNKRAVSFVSKKTVPPANKEQNFQKPVLRSSARLQAISYEFSRPQNLPKTNPEKKSSSQGNLNVQASRGTVRPRRAVSATSVSKSAVQKVKDPPAHETGENLIPAESFRGAKSLGRSVPREMMSFFNCEDEEEGEFNNHKYLTDLKVGRCNLDSRFDWHRVSELQRRNSLYPPHMRSSYSAEMQFQPPAAFTDDQLREGRAVQDDKMLDLTEAAEQLDLSSPAFNLRKRKSLSDSLSSQSSLTSSAGRKSKRLSTSYSRPGPPTPGRRSVGRGNDKENLNKSILSTASTSSKESKMSLRSMQTPQSNRPTASPRSSRRSSRGSPSSLALRSSKGFSPANKKMKTPSSILRIMARAKSPWRKLQNDDEMPGRPRRQRLVHRLGLKPSNA